MKGRRKPPITVDTFTRDPLYPRIARAVEQILAKGKVVAPVDVLVRMSLLAPERLEDWRRGRVPYLERVIGCNLSRLSRLLLILRFHAHDLKLVPSTTVYARWGKGPKERLRFTKTGEPRLEEAYSRHFVWPGKGPFHPPGTPKEGRPTREALAARPSEGSPPGPPPLATGTGAETPPSPDLSSSGGRTA